MNAQKDKWIENKSETINSENANKNGINFLKEKQSHH